MSGHRKNATNVNSDYCMLKTSVQFVLRQNNKNYIEMASQEKNWEPCIICKWKWSRQVQKTEWYCLRDVLFISRVPLFEQTSLSEETRAGETVTMFQPLSAGNWDGWVQRDHGLISMPEASQPLENVSQCLHQGPDLYFICSQFQTKTVKDTTFILQTHYYALLSLGSQQETDITLKLGKLSLIKGFLAEFWTVCRETTRDYVLPQGQ